MMRSDVAELSATGAALLARKALHKLTWQCELAYPFTRTHHLCTRPAPASSACAAMAVPGNTR